MTVLNDLQHTIFMSFILPGCGRQGGVGGTVA